MDTGRDRSPSPHNVDTMRDVNAPNLVDVNATGEDPSLRTPLSTRPYIVTSTCAVVALSALKERKDEKLKDYLTKFSQEVSEVQDPNDDAAVSVFINSLQHNHLNLSLRRRGPATYANMVDHVRGYAMEDEEQLVHGEELIHGSKNTVE
ncbi:hypothetical protein Ddye_004792 [Dipteronia dyeriana]|uniref:Uncharacterized protein n=1 Tax=Dipteronia dyeriana TaxID=168575 RepID=A0AAD9XF28_9ROSI|nr:hypothetical protein Ddye_004792 [Dipteronia dyeriana]